MDNSHPRAVCAAMIRKAAVASCAAAAIAVASFAAAPTGPADSPPLLPAHLRPALPQGEIVARCEPCGDDCFVVFACAADDTTMGRVLRLWGRPGAAPRRVSEGAWVRSDLAGPPGMVRAFGDLTPDHVRVGIEAVRPRLGPREFVREVRLQSPAAAGGDAVLSVTVARAGGGADAARVVLVHLAPDGAFVESQGIRTH